MLNLIYSAFNNFSLNGARKMIKKQNVSSFFGIVKI